MCLVLEPILRNYFGVICANTAVNPGYFIMYNANIDVIYAEISFKVLAQIL